MMYQLPAISRDVTMAASAADDPRHEIAAALPHAEQQGDEGGGEGEIEPVAGRVVDERAEHAAEQRRRRPGEPAEHAGADEEGDAAAAFAGSRPWSWPTARRRRRTWQPSACGAGRCETSGRSVADISSMRRLTMAVATMIETIGRLPGVPHVERHELAGAGEDQPAHQHHFEHAQAGLAGEHAPDHAVGGDRNGDRQEHADAEPELRGSALGGGCMHARRLHEAAGCSDESC